jgi:HEAT repeat protein
MKQLALATLLVAGGILSTTLPLHAHGGMYRGPGDTVPPGGGGSGVGGPGGPAGPTDPGGTNPGTPTPGNPGPGRGGAPGNSGSPVSGPGSEAADLTQWSFWWEFNKEPYLQLKRAIHGGPATTGSDSWFLGNGEKDQGRDSRRPTDVQIRQIVVPALRAALAKESDNDIVTGCMIALAKIGDAPSESGASEFEPLLRGFLASKNQEISETAAIALGILAHEKSIGTLAGLIDDSDEARGWVGQPEVPYRTRAFAAYGLGLVGETIGRESDRLRIVEILHGVLRSDLSKTRDVKAACVIALGMVPLEAGTDAEGETADGLAPRTRSAQLDHLLAFLRDESQPWLVRAHCPRSLTRLCNANLSSGEQELYRERIANELLALLAPRAKQPVELVQSSALALGQLGTNDLANPLDRRILEALAGLPKEVSDQQARHFSLIALAQIGARTAADAQDPEGGIEFASKSLLAQLAGGKSAMPSWAGLACGVLGHGLAASSPESSRIAALQTAVRSALAEERSGERIGALAVAAGIQKDLEASGHLLQLLRSSKDEETQGYVALGLGLMGASEAVVEIHDVLAQSKYRPALLKQAAIALGLLGDKNAVDFLTAQLASAQGLATQAALSTALGFIGDTRSVDPLVAMLQNGSLTPKARGFAAAALGMVADEAELPWNSAVGLDLNYRASTSTLTDQANGTGILDIL